MARNRGTGLRAPALILTVASLLLLPVLPGATAAAEKVTFSLEWLPVGMHAVYFVAREKGFYRAEGIETTIERGYGSGDTAKKVSAGGAHFGISDPGSVSVGRAQGMGVKQLAVTQGSSRMVIFTLKGSGITKPKDLEGRQVGVSTGDAIHVAFPAFAQANGLKKWDYVFIEPASKNPSLLAGRVDSIGTMYNLYPIVREGAKKLGKEVLPILMKDHGVDVYSDGLVTTDALVQKEPDLVRRFTRAWLKGIVYGAENREEAVQIFLALHPNATPALVREETQIYVEFMMTPEARQRGIGYMNEEKIRFTRDLYLKAHKIEKDVPVRDVYTNEFIPGKMLPGN